MTLASSSTMHRASAVISKLVLLWAAGVLASFSIAAATPLVAAVSGSVAQGSHLTISGSGFGTKSPAKPYLWAPMDGSSRPSSLGIVTSWTSLVQLTYANHCGPAGGGCLVGTPSNGVSTNAWTASITSPANSDWNAYGRKIYIYRKSKRDFSYNISKNVKIIRMWGMGTPSSPLARPTFYFATSNGRVEVAGIPQNGPLDYTMPPATLRRAMGPVGQWYTEEILIKSNSSPDSADGDFRLDINGGADLVSFPNRQWETNTLTLKVPKGYAGDGRMRILYPIHMVVEGSDGWVPTPAGSQYWVTDVYVDNTWARVMIGDSPVFSRTTDREIQIPYRWSDHAIKVHVNIDAFPPGKPMYLFVVDANGHASAGYPLKALSNDATSQNQVDSLPWSGIRRSVRVRGEVHRSPIAGISHAIFSPGKSIVPPRKRSATSPQLRRQTSHHEN